MKDIEKKLKNASYSSKENWKMPKGAEVTKKDFSVRVQEIENGFIVTKSYDLEYMYKGEKNYQYISKQWYSKENPLDFDIDEKNAKYLAEEFDE